jgi:hypothetical protein
MRWPFINDVAIFNFQMSYVANPDGYETRHYCWMSIEKGMVVSFIVPVFLLIGVRIFYSESVFNIDRFFHI